MANIEAAANHTIRTKGGTEYSQAHLDIGPDDMNLVLRALNNGKMSAISVLHSAQETGNTSLAQSAMSALVQSQALIEGIIETDLDEGAEIEGVADTRAISFGPQEIATIVANLLGYEAKTRVALARVKTDNLEVVDVAEGAKLEDKQVPLYLYNRAQFDTENARPLAQKFGKYLRESVPEIVQVNLDAILKRFKDEPNLRDELMAEDVGSDVTAYQALLDNTAILLGYEWDILDGMIQSVGSLKNRT